MDKNSLIGLGIIAAILGIWLYMNGPTEAQIARSKQIKDSLNLVEQERREIEAAKIAVQKNDTSKISEKAQDVPDSVKTAGANEHYRDFAAAAKGQKQIFTIENENLKAYISNKGGQIVKVELKGYHRPGKAENLVLFNEDSTHFALMLNAYDRSRLFSTDSFFFKPVQQNASRIVLRLETTKPGSFIEYSYSLKPGDYMVDSDIRLAGMQNIISQTEDQLQLSWSMLYPSQEEHIVKEQEAATIYFMQDLSDPDYINPMKDEQKELNDANIKWISFKQQFFNSTIIANGFFKKEGSYIKSMQRPGSDSIVKAAACELGIPYNHAPDEKFSFRFYFGPNHYNTLQQYGHGLENIIPTGWSIFSYINKWLVIPLFNWKLSNLIGMGMMILLLTVIVKIVLLPIAYKTYMSGAKMRVLKPETDALTAKFGKNPDPMKKQQEQMALYRKAGVNPLSGCIPLLLQFPILIALFNFVPAAIELRQEGFIWASDLSTYDSIWTFGDLPFIGWAYGDHVSLFALLMFVSTIFYTWMNSSMMPQQGGAQMPGMKFMMYFMPVIFLAVMNKYAAGLSWYYFLANMLTFLQNWIIKKIVSDDKIRAQLEANMKKPLKVSGFQKRLEEMTKQRQQAVRKK